MNEQTSPPKKHSVLKGLLIVLGFLLVVGFLASKCSSDKKDTSSTDPQTEQTQEETTKAKEWVEVMKIKGSGDKKSASFTLTGAKARMKYNFKTSSMGMGMLAAYVLPDGYDLMTQGGIPEIMINQSEEGESNLSHLKKGEYYLNIAAANGNWEVTIEELR